MRLHFALTDDQLVLGSTVRRVLAEHCPARAVREAGRAGERLPGWAQLAEIGLFGMLVARGGDGLGLADAILAFEEAGRAALPGPVVETAVIAPGLLPDDLLDRLAGGSLRVSVRLGHQVYAPDADLADLLIVEQDGVVRVLASDEVRLTPQPGVDPVRRLFSVAAAPVRGGGVLSRARTVPVLRAATVAVAAQLIGLARRLLEESVARAKAHDQVFPVLKHRLADVAIAIDFAAPHVYAAAVAVDDQPRLGETELLRAVSAAKASAGEAASLAARAALQVHAPPGYDDDLDLRLWLARVWSLASAYGDTGVHRARLRSAVLGTSELHRL
ncbi:acyl-CoA dehydrogenase family protein [Acrocarpospora phusangensis]|uniref:acyl-CoA dehydrogenase family protein n=1 Tax=Acrocarpospora phusangensis TaxID=1070424 RepID=UPI001950AD9C|nr:acyl-CoA dehydrogenase family protein [Acrocarpospora phusangensis]